LNIEKLKKNYEGEWLLIKITVADEQDQPVEGEVLLQSKSSDEV